MSLRSPVCQCAICNRGPESSSYLSREGLWTNNSREKWCMHQFCTDCKEKMFRTKKEFCCPLCQALVKRANLEQKFPDAIEVDEDARVRKRIKQM